MGECIAVKPQLEYDKPPPENWCHQKWQKNYVGKTLCKAFLVHWNPISENSLLRVTCIMVLRVDSSQETSSVLHAFEKLHDLHL